MNNENVGFVEFHRPGRLILIGGILIPVAVLFFGLAREPLLMVLSLVGAPFVLLLMDFVSKRKLLPHTQNSSVLQNKLCESKISWLYKDNGRGGQRVWTELDWGYQGQLVIVVCKRI